jgi:hypothetical protein
MGNTLNAVNNICAMAHDLDPEQLEVAELMMSVLRAKSRKVRAAAQDMSDEAGWSAAAVPQLRLVPALVPSPAPLIVSPGPGLLPYSAAL